jgi:hypothetical protein
MKRVNSIWLFAIVFMSAACLLVGCVVDTFDTKLIVFNKTPETVFVELSKFKSFESHPVPIDTIKGDTLWNYMRWIPPMDSLNSQPPFGSWERYINEDCIDSTLTVFIFNRELLKSAPRDSLIAKQLYTKRYSYKVKDLERLNWRIEYK